MKEPEGALLRSRKNMQSLSKRWTVMIHYAITHGLLGGRTINFKVKVNEKPSVPTVNHGSDYKQYIHCYCNTLR